MLTDAFLEQLRFKGEGSGLDYKAERYKFAGASDEEKSELLKDVLAVANAHRDGTGYLLLGFKENAPQPAEVVGLSADGAIDDSRIQQFVNSKLESKLDFRYEERVFEGKTVGVVSIPKQSRPFYLSKPYGKLLKDTVYIRRGSSTDIASPREIATMGQVDQSKGAARLDIHVLDTANQSLANSVERTFYVVGDLPDFSFPRSRDSMLMLAMGNENVDFWRESASYLSAKNASIRVGLSVTNRSEFALSNAKLEATWIGDGSVGRMLLDSDMPDRPSEYSQLEATPWFSRTCEIDEHGPVPVFAAVLGDVRPGETRRAEEKLTLLPEASGVYTLSVRILAAELPAPFCVEHQVMVSGHQMYLNPQSIQAALDDEDNAENP